MNFMDLVCGHVVGQVVVKEWKRKMLTYDWSYVRCGHVIGHVVLVDRCCHVVVAKTGKRSYDRLSPCGDVDWNPYPNGFLCKD